MARHYVKTEVNALFITRSCSRLNRNGLYEVVVEHAKRVGLHDSKSPDLEYHFTPPLLPPLVHNTPEKGRHAQRTHQGTQG